MEHRRNDTDRGKSEFSQKIFPLPLFHQKSHMGYPRTEGEPWRSYPHKPYGKNEDSDLE